MRPRIRSFRYFQIASADRGAAGNEIVDADDLVDRIDLVEQQRQLRIVGNMRLRAVQVAIDLVENIANVETVAHCWQAAGDRAGA